MKRCRVVIFIITATMFLMLSRYKKTGIDTKAQKSILYWTPQFGELNFGFGPSFESCAYKNCYATFDRSHVAIDRFDAIIFHAVEYTAELFGTPRRRNAGQMYVYGNLEPPTLTNDFVRNFTDFYNWTMTYRSDADIPRPYGSYRKQKTTYQPPAAAQINAKPAKVAWFVNRCTAYNGRELIVKELSKLVTVDVFGQCGDLSCPKNEPERCYNMLEANYKFYLSFENSLCEDYVTEKMYNVLKRNVVPIVYGAADYRKVAPPNSVINVMDFKSVEELADRITYLDSHTEEYLKLFEWKKDYVVETIQQRALCALCRKLNENIRPKTYENIVNYWNGEHANKCHNNFVDKFLKH